MLNGFQTAALALMALSFFASADTEQASALTRQRNAGDLRVFFGHQSVGDNILEGLREISPGLVIIRGSDPRDTPGIMELAIGRNGDPASKLSHFARVLDGLAGHVDVAIMKFCYVDFTVDTDLRRLEKHYADTFTAVGRKHPRIRVVHMTTPLTVTQIGPTAALKRLLGRPVYGERENQKRAEFNEWLRVTYATGLIFDLADIESTDPEGRRVTFDLGERSYPKLHEAYTQDGSHLNPVGRRRVAAALLTMLAGLRRQNEY